METKKITIEADISTTIEKVWDFYTQPEHITNWNFASPDWYCPSAENDLRIGGKHKARMEAKDGSFGFDFEAVYTEVANQNRLSYKMADGRECTILFEEYDEQTKVTITFDSDNQNPIDMQRGGWQAILNNFKSYCETH